MSAKNFYRDWATLYSLQYETLVVLGDALGNVIYKSAGMDMGIGVDGFSTVYPAWSPEDADAQQTDWEGDTVGGQYIGRLISMDPIKRMMTDIQIGGDANDIEEQTWNLKISDNDGSILNSFGQVTELAAGIRRQPGIYLKGAVVFLFVKPPRTISGDDSKDKVPFVFNVGTVRDFSVDYGVISLTVCDGTKDALSVWNLAGASDPDKQPGVYTKNKFALLDDSLVGTMIPIIYGAHVGTSFRQKGAISLTCVDSNTTDRTLKNRTFVVAAHDCYSVISLWEYNTNTQVYKSVDSDVASKGYDNATATYQVRFTHGRGLGAASDGSDDYDYILVADVRGRKDSDGRLIENPARVLVDFFQNYTAYPDTDMADSVDGIAKVFAANQVRAAGMLTDLSTKPAQIIKDICSNFNLRIFLAAKQNDSANFEMELLCTPTEHKYAYNWEPIVSDPPVPADYAANWRLYDSLDILEGTFEQTWDGLNLVNSYLYNWAPDERGIDSATVNNNTPSSGFLGHGSMSDSSSIERYQKIEQSIDLNWIRDVVSARAMIGVKIFRYGTPLPRVTLKTSMNASFRELGRVAFLNHFRYQQQAGDLGQVGGATHQPADRPMILEMLSVDPLAALCELQLLGVDYLWENRYFLHDEDAKPSLYTDSTNAQRRHIGYLCDEVHTIQAGVRIDAGVFSNGDPGRKLWALDGPYTVG